ncbi:MAG: HsdR family type I site-specific deoxyribonuclease [Spirochaetota bacterium]|jgi:type I restriction enzyme R subunit|nr:HsdR family type I site-specific deoxyribonuclease [Spirochaetota bacterium]
MAKINESEREVQNRVARFFQDDMGYAYYGNLSAHINANIIPEKLQAFLKKRGCSEILAGNATAALMGAAGNMRESLYAANKNVYSLMKYGVKIKERAGEPEKTIYYIDWEHPRRNEFAIAEEVTIKDKGERRPDMVVYINGIAIAVLELKKSTVSVAQGIRQSLSNKTEYFNASFFSTIQIILAGNTSEGARYGTIDTDEKHFMEWKNDAVHTGEQPLDEVSREILEVCSQYADKLDAQLYSMFHKRRVLDIMHNFIIFDSGRKKLCRPCQYFGVKKAQIKISKKQGGIIWHTQGSGKTLTMVWLSKWILSDNPAARVLIITDRTELDAQIETRYKGVGEKVYRTTSCKDLIARLDTTSDRLMCSLIHKFGRRSEVSDLNYEKYIEELKRSLPPGFSAKGDIVVFVDECHRTQSGRLHMAMKEILPKAVFIGFTGTPLLVKDRAASTKVFGGYIHTYKYSEGVLDRVVLDLRYEARGIEQVIKSKKKIDQYFAAKTRGLSKAAQAALKARWAIMEKVYSSRQRLEVIAADIIHDFGVKSRLADDSGNAILVADSIYSACRYYELFLFMGFKRCAVITSYDPRLSNISKEASDSEEFQKYEAYTKMLGTQNVEDFEAAATKKFVEEPAQMKLLIVVDKLLTGFDAPPCTYLYIDKQMQDHQLFQAICRVNRLDGESKDFGYIVDYKQLFSSLADAIGRYTGDALAGYDEKDIRDLLKKRFAAAKEDMDAALEQLHDLQSRVPSPREALQYQHYFCGESGKDAQYDEEYARRRENLYKMVNRLIRAYTEMKGSMDTAYTTARQDEIRRKVILYTGLKDTISRASGDSLDLEAFTSDMRRLIDDYIGAKDSKITGKTGKFTLLEIIQAQGEMMTGKGKGKESAAEAIENNIRKKIVEKMLINPKYYEKLSALLDEIIKQRHKETVNYKKLLKQYNDLADKIEHPEKDPRYPAAINSPALRALYDYGDSNERLAIVLHTAVLESKLDGFRNNTAKANKIKKVLYDILKAEEKGKRGYGTEEKVEQIYEIVIQQEEY